MLIELTFTFVIYNTRWHREGDGRYWNHIPYPEGIINSSFKKKRIIQLIILMQIQIIMTEEELV